MARVRGDSWASVPRRYEYRRKWAKRQLQTPGGSCCDKKGLDENGSGADLLPNHQSASTEGKWKLTATIQSKAVLRSALDK